LIKCPRCGYEFKLSEDVKNFLVECVTQRIRLDTYKLAIKVGVVSSVLALYTFIALCVIGIPTTIALVVALTIALSLGLTTMYKIISKCRKLMESIYSSQFKQEI